MYFLTRYIQIIAIYSSTCNLTVYSFLLFFCLTCTYFIYFNLSYISWSSRCRKIHSVTHRTFSTLGSGGSHRILPPFQGFKDRIAILLSPSLNVSRPEHVRQRGYDRSNLTKWTFYTRGDQVQIPRLLYFKRWIWYNRCPIKDRFCSSRLWSIIQMHISISKHWS